MMTDFAVITSPSSNLTFCTPEPDDSDTALDASFMRTPNFWACKAARAASSSPDRPAGKPSRFSIRDDVPACPPTLGLGPTAAAGPGPDPPRNAGASGALGDQAAHPNAMPSGSPRAAPPCGKCSLPHHLPM